MDKQRLIKDIFETMEQIESNCNKNNSPAYHSVKLGAVLAFVNVLRLLIDDLLPSPDTEKLKEEVRALRQTVDFCSMREQKDRAAYRAIEALNEVYSILKSNDFGEFVQCFTIIPKSIQFPNYSGSRMICGEERDVLSVLNLINLALGLDSRGKNYIAMMFDEKREKFLGFCRYDDPNKKEVTK